MLNKFSIVIALTLLVTVPVAADTPEMACWENSEVAQAVVLDTIGTVVIGTRLDGQKAVKTYIRKAERFEFDKSMKVLEETLPLSSYNCTRAPSWGYTAGGRYPVVDEAGSYIQVVVDPSNDTRVWIDRRELASDFYSELQLFDSPKSETVALLPTVPTVR
jgi:hypothetical protein